MDRVQVGLAVTVEAIKFENGAVNVLLTFGLSMTVPDPIFSMARMRMTKEGVDARRKGQRRLRVRDHHLIIPWPEALAAILLPSACMSCIPPPLETRTFAPFSLEFPILTRIPGARTGTGKQEDLTSTTGCKPFSHSVATWPVVVGPAHLFPCSSAQH